MFPKIVDVQRIFGTDTSKSNLALTYKMFWMPQELLARSTQNDVFGRLKCFAIIHSLIQKVYLGVQHCSGRPTSFWWDISYVGHVVIWITRVCSLWWDVVGILWGREVEGALCYMWFWMHWV